MTLQEHLESIDACKPARLWARNRTSQQAWDECEEPDWLTWWVVKDRPEWGRRIILLMVRKLRVRLLDRASKLRNVTAAALDAAEAWALNPSRETRAAALAAADAADILADASDADSYKSHLAAEAARDASTIANYAVTANNCFLAAAISGIIAEYSASVDDHAIWLTAIRSEFTCPWTEDQE